MRDLIPFSHKEKINKKELEKLIRRIVRDEFKKEHFKGASRKIAYEVVDSFVETVRKYLGI